MKDKVKDSFKNITKINADIKFVEEKSLQNDGLIIADKKIMKSKISNYPVATFNKLPKDIRDKVKIIQKIRLYSKCFSCLGHRPDELRAFFNYHDVIMERNSNLTKAEKK